MVTVASKKVSKKVQESTKKEEILSNKKAILEALAQNDGKASKRSITLFEFDEYRPTMIVDVKEPTVKMIDTYTASVPAEYIFDDVQQKVVANPDANKSKARNKLVLLCQCVFVTDSDELMFDSKNDIPLLEGLPVKEIEKLLEVIENFSTGKKDILDKYKSAKKNLH